MLVIVPDVREFFRVLSIAHSYGYTSLIFGAWGCGAFGNEPSNIARYLKKIINRRF
jgi:uncharacterized protein (TIGR02452 family)